MEQTVTSEACSPAGRVPRWVPNTGKLKYGHGSESRMRDKKKEEGSSCELMKNSGCLSKTAGLFVSGRQCGKCGKQRYQIRSHHCFGRRNRDLAGTVGK